MKKTRWRTSEDVCCRFYIGADLRNVHERGCPNRGSENVTPAFFKRGRWYTYGAEHGGELLSEAKRRADAPSEEI